MKLTPLRVLVATAPSGGQIRFVKYTDLPAELSFYHGLLNAAEDALWWKAKLAAEKPGLDNWNRAAAILVSAGWVIVEDAT